jgi:hypothetical protein
MYRVFCLFCLSSSFAWWWPTCIVFFVLFCLSSSFAWWWPTCIVFFVCFVCLRLLHGGDQHVSCFLFCFVCLRLLHGGDQHVLCFWFVFFAFVLCLVNQILLVSLDCIFLITSSVSLTFNYIESPVFSSKACRVHPFTSNPLWTRLFKVISWQSCVRLFYFTTYCIS